MHLSLGRQTQPQGSGVGPSAKQTCPCGHPLTGQLREDGVGVPTSRPPPQQGQLLLVLGAGRESVWRACFSSCASLAALRFGSWPWNVPRPVLAKLLGETLGRPEPRVWLVLLPPQTLGQAPAALGLLHSPREPQSLSWCLFLLPGPVCSPARTTKGGARSIPAGEWSSPCQGQERRQRAATVRVVRVSEG